MPKLLLNLEPPAAPRHHKDRCYVSECLAAVRNIDRARRARDDGSPSETEFWERGRGLWRCRRKLCRYWWPWRPIRRQWRRWCWHVGGLARRRGRLRLLWIWGFRDQVRRRG